MSRYAVHVELQDVPDAYRDLEVVIEAADPRLAAARAFELAGVHPDEEFPQLLVVPEVQVHVYTRDDAGKAVTADEDLPRLRACWRRRCLNTKRQDCVVMIRQHSMVMNGTLNVNSSG
jgi:hypothetical protein